MKNMQCEEQVILRARDYNNRNKRDKYVLYDHH